MKTLVNLAVLLAVIGGAAATASADEVSILGDKDGLGIGVLDGAAFDFSLVGPPDGNGTDEWRYGSQSWLQTYDPTGATAASLAIFTGGQGWFGASTLLLDGQAVGFLTDGDGYDGGDEANRGRFDVFDLTPYLSLLTGSTIFTVQTVNGGDGWALDYSELTLRTRAVPEPATMVLLGAGTLGLLAARRRRNRMA